MMYGPYILAAVILLLVYRVYSGNRVYRVETLDTRLNELVAIRRQRVGPGPFVLSTLEKFFVFNPSILYHKGKLLVMARLSSTAKCHLDTQHFFRDDATIDSVTDVFHRDHKSEASLIIKWYHDSPFAYVVLNNYTTDYNKMNSLGMEDPRLFKFKSDTWVYTHYRAIRNNAFVHVPIIFKLESPDKLVYLSLKGMTLVEKNWMPFEHEGDLYFEYTIAGPRQIIRCNVENGVCTHVSTEYTWLPFTRHIGGGAPPVKINSTTFLGIAHTRENGQRPIRKNFFYTFQSEPPFSLLHCSPEFVVESETNDIEFASGLCLDPKENSVVVSVGIEDCYSTLVYYTLEDVLSFTSTPVTGQ